MIFTRHAALAVFASATATPVFAQKPPFFETHGIALCGYDPVAYFTKNAPRKGIPEYSTVWRGITWYFSTEFTKSIFDQDPDKYAPQYGGYCAYGVANGATNATAPDAWSIYNGKLYLTHDTYVREIWRDQLHHNIQKANLRWPNVLDL